MARVGKGDTPRSVFALCLEGVLHLYHETVKLGHPFKYHGAIQEDKDDAMAAMFGDSHTVDEQAVSLKRFAGAVAIKLTDQDLEVTRVLLAMSDAIRVHNASFGKIQVTNLLMFSALAKTALLCFESSEVLWPTSLGPGPRPLYDKLNAVMLKAFQKAPTIERDGFIGLNWLPSADYVDLQVDEAIKRLGIDPKGGELDEHKARLESGCNCDECNRHRTQAQMESITNDIAKIKESLIEVADLLDKVLEIDCLDTEGADSDV
jgi:hypothetical protein